MTVCPSTGKSPIISVKCKARWSETSEGIVGALLHCWRWTCGSSALTQVILPPSMVWKLWVIPASTRIDCSLPQSQASSDTQANGQRETDTRLLNYCQWWFRWRRLQATKQEGREAMEQLLQRICFTTKRILMGWTLTSELIVTFILRLLYTFYNCIQSSYFVMSHHGIS